MFWKRKNKPPEGVSLEQQLSALAECGLEPCHADACRRAVDEWGREDLESPPYDLILTFLGSVFEDNDGREQPMSSGIWHLDTECICDAEDYVNAMRRLRMLARGDLLLEDIEAHFGETAWVEFRIGDETSHWEFEVSNDWIDMSIIEHFVDLLAVAVSNRRYCVEESGGQDLLVICPTREEFDSLTQLTVTKFERLGPEW